ncbi:MAG: hypothetical protein WC707_06100 [Candidatus Babeliaceae bacterium]
MKNILLRIALVAISITQFHDKLFAQAAEQQMKVCKNAPMSQWRFRLEQLKGNWDVFRSERPLLFDPKRNYEVNYTYPLWWRDKIAANEHKRKIAEEQRIFLEEQKRREDEKRITADVVAKLSHGEPTSREERRIAFGNPELYMSGKFFDVGSRQGRPRRYSFTD